MGGVEGLAQGYLIKEEFISCAFFNIGCAVYTGNNGFVLVAACTCGELLELCVGKLNGAVIETDDRPNLDGVTFNGLVCHGIVSCGTGGIIETVDIELVAISILDVHITPLGIGYFGNDAFNDNFACRLFTLFNSEDLFNGHGLCIGFYVTGKAFSLFLGHKACRELGLTGVVGIDVRCLRDTHCLIGAVGAYNIFGLINGGEPSIDILFVVPDRAVVAIAEVLGKFTVLNFFDGSGNILFGVTDHSVDLEAAFNLFYEEVGSCSGVNSGLNVFIVLGFVGCIKGLA